jgi:hypothetical protein
MPSDARDDGVSPGNFSVSWFIFHLYMDKTIPLEVILCHLVCDNYSVFVSIIMGEIAHCPSATASLQPPLDDRLLLKWLENQSEEAQSK